MAIVGRRLRELYVAVGGLQAFGVTVLYGHSGAVGIGYVAMEEP